MDWPNERYVRAYSRDTAEWMTLSWQARALFWEVLRKCDRSGFASLGKHGPRALAGLIRWPVEVVESALAELVADGKLLAVDGGVVDPTFLASQECAASDRMRQAESRARRREAKLGNIKLDNGLQSVTGRHDRSRSVTTSHEVSLRAGPSLAEPSLSKEESANMQPPATVTPSGVSGAQAAGPLPGDVLKLVSSAEKTPGGRRKPPGPPLPFTVPVALGAMHATAGPLFPTVEPRDVSKGHAIAINAAIRAYPTIDEWQTLGAFLAAGGVDWPRPPLGPSWVAGAKFREAMAAARAWHAGGRGPVTQRDVKPGNGRAGPMAVSASFADGIDQEDAFDVAVRRRAEQTKRDEATIATIKTERQEAGR